MRGNHLHDDEGGSYDLMIKGLSRPLSSSISASAPSLALFLQVAWWRTELMRSFILAILIRRYIDSEVFFHAGRYTGVPGGGDVLGGVLSLAGKIKHSVYLTRI